MARRHLPAAGRGDRPRARGHPRRPLSPGRLDASRPRRPERGRGRRLRAGTQPRQSASPELVAAIGELTDGTPLLVCELWRELVAREAVEVSDGQVTLLRPVAELRGAQRIHELVRAAPVAARTRGAGDDRARSGRRATFRAPRHRRGRRARPAGARPRRSSRRRAADWSRSCRSRSPPPASRTSSCAERCTTGSRASACRSCTCAWAMRVEQAHAADLGARAPRARAPLHPCRSARGRRARRSPTTCGRPKPPCPRWHTGRRRRGSRPRSSWASRIRASGHASQAELGHLLYETGRLAESDAIMAASLEAATSLDERGLAARALVQRSNQRLASDPAVSAAEMVPVAEDAISDVRAARGHSSASPMAEHLLGHALRVGKGGASRPRGTRPGVRSRGASPATRSWARTSSGGSPASSTPASTPVGEAIDPARAASVVEPERSHPRCGAPPGPRALLCRWPAASTRRGSTSRPATASSSTPSRPSFHPGPAAVERRRGAGARRRPRRRRAAVRRRASSACAMQGARRRHERCAWPLSLRCSCCDQRRWDEAESIPGLRREGRRRACRCRARSTPSTASPRRAVWPRSAGRSAKPSISPGVRSRSRIGAPVKYRARVLARAGRGAEGQRPDGRRR